MKKIFLVVLLLVSQLSFGQSNDNAIRLFVIGNSFSQNATAYLPNFAKERNKQLVIGRAELGGCSLQQHWEYAEAAEANPGDPKGKPYKGKSLRMLLSEGTWDVVTIQQYSYLSPDLDTYSPYAEKLYNYIKSIQPNARIVLHQNWAYRSDAKKFGRVAANQLAKDQKEMWQKSRAAYHTIAEQLKVNIIPVGDAFNTMASGTEFLYKKDMAFDYENPVYPNLPDQTNSLNMGYYWKDKEFVFDPNHANEAGRYLGSLIWYAFLFKESPEKIQYVPNKVPVDFAAYLRKVAEKTVKF
ncbi:DUF4886 domain-containing protein [Pedobacter sp.]|uniref:DUF4886 domain-containing protein n=1 Tax=Pedobacter sp. TaxID=1411316 RepID=UPI002CE8CE76|nr:DUF4886 domain-containing protein [Pedobacter sp.]HWW40198.1 DUF4886 domain-containing protein [Pedobacter sp.]